MGARKGIHEAFDFKERKVQDTKAEIQVCRLFVLLNYVQEIYTRVATLVHDVAVCRDQDIVQYLRACGLHCRLPSHVFSTEYPQSIVLSAGTSYTLPITFRPLEKVRRSHKIINC